MKVTKTVTIEWHEVSDEPPKDTFFPLIIQTPEGIRTSRYVGDDVADLAEGVSVVDGFLRGGWWFTAVSRWAFMNDVVKAFEE